MQEVNFVTPLHLSSRRNYLERMTAEKPECMRVAKEYGYDYWDGDRKYGYGGHKYDGRWKQVAEAMLRHYGLCSGDTVLDIGCGKGYLLYDLAGIGLTTHGMDISGYAIREAQKRSIIPQILITDNCIEIPWGDKAFDLTYSINVFHNLGYKDLKAAIREMVRVTKDKSYICVESYRTEEELQNLQCWALTCQSFYTPDDWKEILADNGYRGDVEFIYFT